MNVENYMDPMQAQPPVEEALELRRHLHILRSRFWTILACTVVVFTLSAVRAFRATPVYESSARLLVESRTPQITPFDGVQEYRDVRYSETQAQLITSRVVLEKALEQPGVAAVFEERPLLETARPGLLRSVQDELATLFTTEPTRPLEPWEHLRTRVETRPVRDTNLLDLRVSGQNPHHCALVANAVAQAYVEYSIETRRQTAGDAFETLQALKAEQEQILNQAEAAFYAFQEEAALAEVGLPGRGDAVKERLQTLNSEINRLQMRRMDLAIASQGAEAVRAEMDGAPEALVALGRTLKDPQVSAGIDGLRQLDVERHKALQTFGPSHPNIVAFDEQRALLLQQVEEAVAAHLGAVQIEHEMLREREAELHRVLAEQNRFALEMTKSSAGFERLRKDVERQAQVFDVILDRMRQVDLTRDTGATNVRLVEKAAVPTVPYRPNRQRSLTVGLMLGLFLGLGLAYVHEWLDDTVKTPDDIEDRLGIPVLGFVPEMQPRSGAGEDFEGMALHTLHSPTSVVSEAFRAIRTNIYFSGTKDESRSLVVLSPGPNEGKTLFACNLAVTLAQDGRRVLLVDADLRRPKVHKAFGRRRSPGLTNVLVEGESFGDMVFCPEDDDGQPLADLHVLCAGSKTPNPAELIGSQAMEKFMAEVRDKYDMVVYDSGAALMIADTAIIASRCDGAVLIAKAASSRRGVVGRLKRQLEAVRCRVVGAILNDVRPGALRRSYGYGSYYGSYYGYGYGYGYGYYQQTDDEPEDG